MPLSGATEARYRQPLCGGEGAVKIGGVVFLFQLRENGRVSSGEEGAPKGLGEVTLTKALMCQDSRHQHLGKAGRELGGERVRSGPHWDEARLGPGVLTSVAAYSRANP